MRRTLILSLETALLLMLKIGVAASTKTTKTCTPAEVKRARREAGQLKSWNDLHASFLRFGRCDSGKVAEEYSYVVSRFLAHDWDRVTVLLSLAADDPDFKQFVLRHIDENIPEGDAQLIMKNSRERCPPGGEWLCHAIADY